MKKVYLSVILCSFVFPIIATSQVKWAIFGGFNANTAKYKTGDYGTKVNANFTPGFHIGISRKYTVEDNIIFNLSVVGMKKGYKALINSVDTASIETGYYSIDIPIMLQYNLSNKKNKLIPYIAIGPCLGFNLSGKNKVIKANGTSIDADMVWGFQEYARYEGGLNLLFGAQLKSGLFAEIKAYSGLATIWNMDNGAIIKPKSILLTIGYTFGHAKKLAFE